MKLSENQALLEHKSWDYKILLKEKVVRKTINILIIIKKTTRVTRLF